MVHNNGKFKRICGKERCKKPLERGEKLFINNIILCNIIECLTGS